MSRYDQDWADALAASVGASADEAAGNLRRLLYVVTDTDDGKAAFHLEFAGGQIAAVTAGRLPRGTKADLTITAREETLLDLWSGERTRDTAFMAGDLKLEGAYEWWLDDLALCFEAAPWADAWRAAAS